VGESGGQALRQIVRVQIPQVCGERRTQGVAVAGIGENSPDALVPRARRRECLDQQIDEVQDLDAVFGQGGGELIVFILRPADPRYAVEEQFVVVAWRQPFQFQAGAVQQHGLESSDFGISAQIGGAHNHKSTDVGSLAGMTDASVAVVIPAKDEAARIGATVEAAFKLPAADVVVVVDDGSSDGTASSASASGACVVTHSRNRGKAAAMETGASAVSLIDQREARDSHRLLLFLDADLEESAANAAALLEPVVAGEADVTIATLPPQRTAGGGRGYVVRLARAGVEQATGWTPTQPLSGQRCLTWEAYEAAVPLAPGWGVEVGMTIDLLRAGFRVQEVEVPLHHRVTGTDFAAQLHRARQLRDVGWALASRGVRPHLPSKE
jgi:hypothetical protein